MSKIPTFNYFSQFLIICATLLISACVGVRKASDPTSSLYQHLIETSPEFNRSYTGFVLFDPETKEILFHKNADRYFTPASNTKIFTLYTCLQLLGDSIPAIRYTEQGDSLIFWGTGDPSLRHPYLSANDKLINFLKTQEKQLFFNSGNFKDSKFGAGWSWDDYYSYYQPEKSALPFHGNVIQVDKEEMDTFFKVVPEYFSNTFVANPFLEGRRIKRMLNFNIFEYKEEMLQQTYENDHPYIYSDELVTHLLKEECGKNIQLLSDKQSPTALSKTLYSFPVDSLYQRMMQESDNFIAEQLLLLCSDAVFNKLNTEQLIEYATDSFLQDLPDEAIWADGSGLSRYNLFTPRTIVYLLSKLRDEIGEQRLFQLFASGGVSGTIENWYAGAVDPYVFAKTGTLSNNHCLSGYLITAGGKTLIFSFMHNNYKGSSTPFKKDMEKVLRAIHQQY